MLGKDYSSSLIETKLHRPPLPVEIVPRPRLLVRLEQHRGRPLTLVSAPAGYGKSTLINTWLESVDCPSAWLSLDEHDNELEGFLSYFLAAIQTIFPDAMPETDALLMSTPLPPISAIANILINELNQIEEPFILVLDDYHLIETQAIHELMNKLLRHPPRNLHLVLSTRMDPLLPIVTFRAKNQVTEIRTQDLRFNQSETLLLFQKLIETPVDRAAIIEMNAQAEGWVTGLRLAALAMRHRIRQDSLQGELSMHNSYVTGYLMAEILENQTENQTNCMLKTSLLGRFCAGLCEAVCIPGAEPSGDESEGSSFSGVQFLEWLLGSNLFVIPLNDQYEWFRYHQLFRDFLQKELTRRFGTDEIREVHANAGRWFAQNGWVEEALYHLLAAGDTAAAIEVVFQHRYTMLNATQWQRLEKLLNLFSAEVVENSAELWMLKTWLVFHRGKYADLPASLEHLDTILNREPNRNTARRLAGEISCLRSLIAYHVGDSEGTIAEARQALENVPAELWIARILARTYLGAGLLMKGDINGGYHAYYDAFEEEKVQNKHFKATMLMTACHFHWITADLKSMKHAAKRCIALCEEADYQQILGYGNYHLGCVRYQQNRLSAAAELFSNVVARPYLNYGISYINSACGLGMTYQALGREAEAREVTKEAIAFLLETGNTTQLPLALVLQAELALMQGNLPAASQWAAKLDPVPPLIPVPYFFSPHLTLVKVWLAQNTISSRSKADELLNQLEEYLAGINNTRFLIETLALRALLEKANGDKSGALKALERALRLAQPGEFIRLFVDLGTPMAQLLSYLRGDKSLEAYIKRIRSAFPESQGAILHQSRGDLPAPLTSRELQILELLRYRLSNKEIASQLVISPGTVKGHTIKIYQKLGVKSRRQAVEKAIALGILAPKFEI